MSTSECTAAAIKLMPAWSKATTVQTKWPGRFPNRHNLCSANFQDCLQAAHRPFGESASANGGYGFRPESHVQNWCWPKETANESKTLRTCIGSRAERPGIRGRPNDDNTQFYRYRKRS